MHCCHFLVWRKHQTLATGVQIRLMYKHYVILLLVIYQLLKHFHVASCMRSKIFSRFIKWNTVMCNISQNSPTNCSF